MKIKKDMRKKGMVLLVGVVLMRGLRGVGGEDMGGNETAELEAELNNLTSYVGNFENRTIHGAVVSEHPKNRPVEEKSPIKPPTLVGGGDFSGDFFDLEGEGYDWLVDYSILKLNLNIGLTNKFIGLFNKNGKED